MLSQSQAEQPGRLSGSRRLLLGDSARDELLGAAEIRTPAFRRSARARGIVRPVAATSVPADGVVRVLPRVSESQPGEPGQAKVSERPSETTGR